MRPLHSSLPVRNSLGKYLKPGGDALTLRMLKLAAPKQDDRIFDAGCGTGTTLSLLQNRGFRHIYGADIDISLLSEISFPTTFQADITTLPLFTSSIDLVICECVYNLTDKARVLKEFARVIHPGGLLALSDIYARSSLATEAEWPIPCCFSSATDLETVEQELSEAGFMLLCLEDHTNHLKQTAAEFVFQYGSLNEFWFAVTGDMKSAGAACNASAAIHPGLYLLLAQRINR